MKPIRDVVIVGAGPAGLTCAKTCAELGMDVAVFERRNSIGKKVCAGGITWNGLLQRGGDISRRSFFQQRIVTPKQNALIRAKVPIIATVSRTELGQLMAKQAEKAGAAIYTGCLVTRIDDDTAIIEREEKGQKKTARIKFNSLVGADGSASMVRRFLALPLTRQGVGINYQLPIVRDEMEWHLDPARFACGYAWIFPHKTTTSVGAYADIKLRSAAQLVKALGQWAAENGIDLTAGRPQAGNVNFDYRGVEFTRRQRIFLAGDAAGLTSGLTGEGIFPAIISGEYIGRKIVDPLWQNAEFTKLIRKHARHTKAILYARKHPSTLNLLCELSCFMLRTGLLPFSAAEMGG